MPDLNHEWTRGQLECLWTAAECCKYWPSCDDVTQSRCHEASHVTPSMDPIIRHNTARLTGGWLLVVCHFPIFPTLHKRTFLRIINNFIKHIRYKAALVRARRYSDGDRWWQCSSVRSILLRSHVKRFDKLTQNSETFLQCLCLMHILQYNCTCLSPGC